MKNIIHEPSNLKPRKGYSDQKIYFSKIDDPHEFPKVKTIWVGHSRVAIFLVKVLRWLKKYI
jgi:hypothetical protein